MLTEEAAREGALATTSAALVADLADRTADFSRLEVRASRSDRSWINIIG